MGKLNKYDRRSNSEGTIPIDTFSGKSPLIASENKLRRQRI